MKDYNAAMSGIARSDQMLSYHSALRKTIRWYKKIGVHVLEKMVINAFYLARFHDPDSVKHLGDFRLMVIKWLIGNIDIPAARSIPVSDFHYLEAIPVTGKKKNPSRACRVCAKNNVRKETRYVCGLCEGKPAMCIEPCFVTYHQQLGVIRPAE